jgi:hypothetical protein
VRRPRSPHACEVIATDEFVRWWQSLRGKEHDAVRVAVDLLEQFGTNLPFPHSSAVAGSKYALRELRRKSAKHQLRVFYIFDKTREAIVLMGGDKLGAGGRAFYEKALPVAEEIWEQYLRERGREGRGTR